MGDSIDHKFHLSGFIPVLAHAEDNHGNVHHGLQITCNDGRVINYPIGQQLKDDLSIGLVAPFQFGPDFDDLGDLQSPFKTRCDEAAKTR